MRPINLKIKGLNSFIESQEINFEKLTDKGLFGIFGPTGSGKSTILDGITLALYGEVARKSKNFMNTNCDNLNVSFEFQISEKEIKRYRVDREFKRDAKTGNVRNKSAIVIDITDGELVLEDKSKNVTSKCEEIIGLKLEDFTRTVVLPQGKFGEFLKLEGKDRRDMLERLFNLHKYGDDLSIKLSIKIKGERANSNVLEGELKGYGDINDEILDEKTKDLAQTKQQYSKCKIELNDAEKNYDESKELWNLQSELKEHLNREKQLKEKQEDINESKKRVDLGESVLKVKPYICGYENTLKNIQTVSNELDNLTKKTEIIKSEKQKTEAVLQTVQEKKEKQVPELKLKEQKLIDAIKEKISLNNLLNEKKSLIDHISKVENNINIMKNNIDINNKDIKNITDNINDKDGKAEYLKIPEDYRKKVNEGLIILNTYENIIKQKNDIDKDIKTTLSNIQDLQNKSEMLSRNLNDREKKLSSDNETLEKLIQNCPGDQDILLNLQEMVSNAKEKWDKYNEYNSALMKSRQNIEILKKGLASNEQEKIKLDDKVNQIRNNIKKTETENIANTLRRVLLKGEPCPVCGSKEHHKENIETLDSCMLENLKSDLKSKEDKTNMLTAQINRSLANLETEESIVKEKEGKIKGLGEEFKSDSVEKLQNRFDKLKDDINNYNLEKTDLENKIKSLIGDKNSLEIEYNKQNASLLHNREYLKKIQDSSRKNELEFEETYIKLSTLRTELSIEDFKSESDEILQKDNQKVALDKEIKKLRENSSKAQQLKEKLGEKYGILIEDLNIKKTTVYEKNKNIEEKTNSIKSKVGHVEDLEGLKKDISNSIVKIEKAYLIAVKNKTEIENQYNECNNQIISAQGNLVSLNQRYIRDKEDLGKVLSEEGIKDINEAKYNFISKVEIDKLKHKIEEYNSILNKIIGAIESSKTKIKNRILTQDKWIEIQNCKDEKTQTLEALKEKRINLEKEVKTSGQRLVNKKDLLKKKEEHDLQLSLLDDLEKLFKGKKFVEFVAANQLKYVSIEACKKLKEITGGNYGLEVDENGKFLIRDYKNGGAQRDASTLSGGETFVASLALALALSAQIQLKGTAPLELFFLDEGFGTLDDDLLEVVMDSIEKIHNDTLSVGIISHIESIKNRVPVKLIVTAAEAGMGGSKVKIERN